MIAAGDKTYDYLRKTCANYHNAFHTPKEIYDGITQKRRTILVPTSKEQVVHHMIVNVLKPIFMTSLIDQSYGSIPGRGCHLAKRQIERWLSKDPINTQYCLKMDIRKYFDSIPHDILKAKLARKIKDDKFLNILFTIIDVQPVGIPLGFYTSQWLANFYLSDLDHYIKERLHAPYYIRYMDDMVVFAKDAATLHTIQQGIQDYLENQLGLHMKDNWQVFPLKNGSTDPGRALDFMGFKFYRTATVLRKKIMLKASRKAKRISRKVHATIYDIRQMMSYYGWMKATDCIKFYLSRIQPYIDFKQFRQSISLFDRRKRNVA